MAFPSILDVATELNELRKDGVKDGEHVYYGPNDSSTADLYVDPGNPGRWYAYGGGSHTGGNTLELVQHAKQYDKREAIQWLQDKFPDQMEQVDQDQVEKRQNAREVLDMASTLAHRTLFNERQDLLENIQERRDFDRGTLKDAELGFLSESDVDALESKFTEEALVESGVFNQGENGIYTHLDHRIIFPYKRHGQVLYLAGRRLPDSNSGGKYHKTWDRESNEHIPYEFTEGRDWNAPDKDEDKLVIAEGFTDAISAHKAGYNVLSPATTEFAEDLVDEIVDKASSYTDVYIAMDEDEGGEAGAEKTARQFVQGGINPQMVQLEDGQDLDDHTSQTGYDLESVLDDSTSFLHHKIDEAESQDKLDRNDHRREVLRMVVSWDKPRTEDLIDLWYERHDSVTKSQLRDLRDEEMQQMQQMQQMQDKSRESQGEKGEGVKTQTSDSQDLLKLSIEDTPDQKRLIDTHQGDMYLTVYLHDGGTKFPAVVTHSQAKRVRHKLREVQKSLGEDKELSDREEERHDYYYADLGDSELRFQHEIPEGVPSSVNHLDNYMLQLIKNDESRDAEDLFDDVKELLEGYWFHYNKEWFDVMTAYAIHTYLAPLLGYTVYMLFKGKEGTGKSQLQDVLSRLTYNGVSSSNSTPSVTVRYAHGYQASVNVDEAEQLSQEQTQKMVGLYNTGYRKGGSYEQVNTDAGKIHEQIRSINSFCPKTMSANNIKGVGFNDAFLSRNLIVQSVEAHEDLKKPEKMSDIEKEKFDRLRHKLAYYCLENHESLVESVENALESLDETGREADKLALVKGLVSHFKGDKRARQVTEMVRSSQNIQETDSLDTYAEELFRFMSKEFDDQASGDDQEDEEFLVKTLRDQINASLGKDEDDDFSVGSSGVKDRLRDFNLVRDESQLKRVSAGWKAWILRDTFVDSCRRYGAYEALANLEEGDDLEEDGSEASGDTPPSDSKTDKKRATSATSATFATSFEEVKQTLADLEDEKQDDTVSFSELLEEVSLDEDELASVLGNTSQKDSLIGKGEVCEPESGSFRTL